MHELPLLIFTLFLQGSVGVTLWLALGGAQASPRNALLPAAGAFVLACLGLLASALHMGYPLNALNALRHVSSSWLSREIVFASLYLAALGLATLLMLEAASGGGGACRAGGRVLHGADLYPYVGCHLAAHQHAGAVHRLGGNHWLSLRGRWGAFPD